MTTPVALITGCSSGIGRALAEAMRDAGYQVWACARTGPCPQPRAETDARRADQVGHKPRPASGRWW